MLMTGMFTGRFGTCEEVARTVLALAESPAYLTAQIIGIDGGFL
jgi:3-oxoacyl-[acyl-carrier protein] reductase